MGSLNGDQFWEAIEVGDVSGGQGATSDKVVEGSTYVNDHFTGWFLLVAIAGELGH